MTARHTPEGDRPGVGRYEIRLIGHLDARWAAWFDGLTVSHEGDGTTLISGPVADQASLHGLLQRVRDLGLPLVSVTRDEPVAPTTHGSGQPDVKSDIGVGGLSTSTSTTTGRWIMTTNRTIAAAPGKPGMSADRKAAVWIGVLYIIGTVALILSAVVTSGVLAGPPYLAQVAAQPNQLAIGAVLVLLAGFALAMVPVVFWPIGRRYNETLAMGYVVFRGAIETILYIVGALGWLVLIALSTEPDAAPLARFVNTLVAVTWDQLIAVPFALGALMFYVLLYQSRLVPRWLSAWGLVGAAIYIVPPLGGMFGLSLGVLMAPLAVQEMVLAVWLIAKGFNSSAAASAPAGGTAPAIEPSMAAAGAR